LSLAPVKSTLNRLLNRNLMDEDSDEENFLEQFYHETTGKINYQKVNDYDLKLLTNCYQSQ
jgi:hypothetical protein